MNQRHPLYLKLVHQIMRIAYALLLTGCLSPIEVDTIKRGGVLTVEGQVSTIADQNYVKLAQSADTERLPIPLQGAIVILFDDIGNSFFYQEDFYKPGSYLLDGFAGIPGNTYHIQVITPTGKTYESAPETMPLESGQLLTSYEIVKEDYTDGEGLISNEGFVKILCNATLPSSKESAYLRWSIQEDFLLSPTDFPDPFGNIPPSCYISQDADPQSIVLINGNNVDTPTIENLIIGSRIVDYSFHEKHYFTTYQSSITKEAHEYWRKVDILANQTGSIFDTPPAEIKGNVINVKDTQEKVYGYFQAANQTQDRFYLLPSDFPFPLLMKSCTYDLSIIEYPSRCLDCLSVRNSSYNRPDWF
jgi:hypothetical protein